MEWLASPGGTKFSKPIIRNVKRRTASLSDVFLHLCEEERWHLLEHFIDEIHKSRH